jgi:hypothetical protein
MGAFPGFDEVIEIKAPSKPVDLISLFVDDIDGVIISNGGIKINCVSLVATDERGVVKLIS